MPNEKTEGATGDLQFWYDLEVLFRTLPDPDGQLRADRDYIVGSGDTGEWRLCGTTDQSLRVRFDALARKAGVVLFKVAGTLLPKSPVVIPNPLDAWLDALRREGRNFQEYRYVIEKHADGTEGAHHRLGTIERLCEASADYCVVLESRAFEVSEAHSRVDKLASHLKSLKKEAEELFKPYLSDSSQAGETAPEPSEAEPDQRPLEKLPAKKQNLERYFHGLTDRQHDCASLKWEYGLSDLEIARRFSLHHSTVQEYLEAAMKRMNAARNSEKKQKVSAKFKPGRLNEED